MFFTYINTKHKQELTNQHLRKCHLQFSEQCLNNPSKKADRQTKKGKYRQAQKQRETTYTATFSIYSVLKMYNENLKSTLE